MPAQKYKKYYQLMTEQNQALFDTFQIIHDGFVKQSDTWSDKFHTVGLEIVDVMRFWERKLCAGMERGAHAQYSNRVAEKFWEEIKKRFSHIELVGVKKK